MKKKPYDILALDLGTTTGFAYVQDGVLKASGTVVLPDHKTHPGLRFLKLHNFLQPFRKVREIMYEDVPRFESAKAAKVYCGLLSLVQLFCALHGIRMTAIQSNSVKKEFTGNGNAKKALMCKVAHGMGWRGGHPDTDIDHDECDALATVAVVLKRRNVELIFI